MNLASGISASHLQKIVTFILLDNTTRIKMNLASGINASHLQKMFVFMC